MTKLYMYMKVHGISNIFQATGHKVPVQIFAS